MPKNTVKDALLPDLKIDNEIVFEDLDSTKSIKTNYLVVNRNFLKLRSYFKRLVDFVLEMNESIKPENIVQEVLDRLAHGKTNIVIRPDLKPNESVIVSGFIVSRDDNNRFTIKRQLEQDDWLTENLIINVAEDISGVRLYPVITAKENYIILDFVEGLYTNVRMILI